jgi:hypothetical protein
MKKLILSVAAVGSLALTGFGQGVIYFDGSNNTSTSPTATSEGQVFLNGVLDTGTDINAELVYGTSSAAVSLANPVVTLLLSSSATQGNSTLGETLTGVGDVTDFGSGVLFDGSGTAYQFPTIASGTAVFFDVYGWTGNFSSYAAALASGTALTGSSGVFSEILASATGTANDIEGMGALNLTSTAVPEPTTMALAGLGGLSLFFLRRKK